MSLVYTKETPASVADVGARLEKAASARKFGVIGIVNLKEKMASRGVAFGPECVIYEVCNPHSAKEVLEKNMLISTALPCRISIYSEGGKTAVSTILPTAALKMFETPEVESIAAEVERDILAMIDEAVAGK